MFRTFFLFLLGSAIFLSTGCMEMFSVITVKKDGSGSIEARMLMGPQMAQMAAMNIGEDGKPSDMMADLRKEMENASKYGEGVKLEKIEEVEKEGGWKGLKAIYSFADVNKLTLGGGEGNGEEGPIMTTPKFKIALAKGATCKLVLTPEKVEPAPEMTEEEKAAEAEADAQSEQMAAMMAPMFAGMKMQMQVKVEGEVVSSNAPEANKLKDGVVVIEVQMDEVLKNPKNLGLLEKASRRGEQITGIPGVKMVDPKQDIVIEFK